MDLVDVLLRLGSAVIAGGLIGLDRYARGKQMGVRTLGLVSLASAALVAGADSLGPDGESRVLQGILTGIGFLGAGVIIHGQADNRVEGLTTAASVWVATAAGSLCGLGAWKIAAVVTVLAGLLLVTGGRAERLLVGSRPADAGGDDEDHHRHEAGGN